MDSKPKNPIFKFISSLEIEKVWFRDLEPRYFSFMDNKLVQIMELTYNLLLSEVNDFKHLISAFEEITVDKLVTDPTAAFYYRSLITFVTRLKFGELLDENISIQVLRQIVERAQEMDPVTLYNLIEATFYSDLTPDPSLLTMLIGSINYAEPFELVFECILRKFSCRCQFEYFWTLLIHWTNDVETTDEIECGRLKKLLILFTIIISQMDETDIMDQIDDWVNELDPGFFTSDDNDKSVVEYLLDEFLLKNVMSFDPLVRALVARGLGLIAVSGENLWTIFSDMFIKVSLYIDVFVIVGEDT